MMIDSRLWALILSLATPGCLWAQLPSPRLDRISPLGAASGGKAELEIVGTDIEEPSLVFDHPGISATKIEGKDRFFQISNLTRFQKGHTIAE
ncbi:MAG: hypothetical protein ACKN9S_10970 [Pirellula sp.]